MTQSCKNSGTELIFLSSPLQTVISKHRLPLTVKLAKHEHRMLICLLILTQIAWNIQCKLHNTFHVLYFK